MRAHYRSDKVALWTTLLPGLENLGKRLGPDSPFHALPPQVQQLDAIVGTARFWTSPETEQMEEDLAKPVQESTRKFDSVLTEIFHDSEHNFSDLTLLDSNSMSHSDYSKKLNESLTQFRGSNNDFSHKQINSSKRMNSKWFHSNKTKEDGVNHERQEENNNFFNIDALSYPEAFSITAVIGLSIFVFNVLVLLSVYRRKLRQKQPVSTLEGNHSNTNASAEGQFNPHPNTCSEIQSPGLPHRDNLFWNDDHSIFVTDSTKHVLYYQQHHLIEEENQQNQSSNQNKQEQQLQLQPPNIPQHQFDLDEHQQLSEPHQYTQKLSRASDNLSIDVTNNQQFPGPFNTLGRNNASVELPIELILYHHVNATNVAKTSDERIHNLGQNRQSSFINNLMHSEQSCSSFANSQCDINN